MKKWLAVMLLVLTLGVGAGTLGISTSSAHAAPYKVYTRRECKPEKKHPDRIFCYNRKYWFWNKASWDSFVRHGYSYGPRKPNPHTTCKSKTKVKNKYSKKTSLWTTTTTVTNTCVTVYVHK